MKILTVFGSTNQSQTRSSRVAVFNLKNIILSVTLWLKVKLEWY